MNIKQSALGILVVAVGVLVLLSNINVEPVQMFFEQGWPIFLVLLGVIMWWSNPRNFIWSSVVMLIGGLLLLKTTEVADISFGAVFWPLIIIGLGLNLMISARQRSALISTNPEDNISAILGGSTSVSNAKDYTGGTVTAILGGVELDLRRAVIKKEATLNITAIMGGIELRLPEEVIVKNRTTSLLGGFDDKTQPTKETGAILNISGPIVMGGIEIKR